MLRNTRVEATRCSGKQFSVVFRSFPRQYQSFASGFDGIRLVWSRSGLASVVTLNLAKMCFRQEGWRTEIPTESMEILNIV